MGIPMTAGERKLRDLSRYPCRTIEGAIRLVALQHALGFVAWWVVEEGDVWCYWTHHKAR